MGNSTLFHPRTFLSLSSCTQAQFRNPMSIDTRFKIFCLCIRKIKSRNKISNVFVTFFYQLNIIIINIVYLFNIFSTVLTSMLQFTLELVRIIQKLYIINPILIWVYPHKQGWLNLPHFGSNFSNYHSLSRSIRGILFSKPTVLLSVSYCVFHVFFGCPLFLHQFCTTHCSHHRSLGPSQNCHLIFPQTPCLIPIQHYRSYTTQLFLFSNPIKVAEYRF